MLCEHELSTIEANFADPLGLWPTWCRVWLGHSKRLITLTESNLPPQLVSLRDPYRVQAIVGDAVRAELGTTAHEIMEAFAPGLRREL